MTSSHSSPQCTAIIVAAGASRRMGFDKLASPLAGAPVLRKTLDAFLAADSITEIIVVCPLQRWEQIIGGGEYTKLVRRIDGGLNRQDSVAAGLRAVSKSVELVAVHDGARPLVAPSDIDRCVDVARIHRAATLARRVTETLKRSDCDDFSAGPISRENLWFMETPQIFEASLLRQAYEFIEQQSLVVTDEVSAVEALGTHAKFVESGHSNFKITTPADLALAEALLR